MNIAALLDAYQKGFISEVLFNEAMNKIDLALFAKGITVELGADKNWELKGLTLTTPSFVWKKKESNANININIVRGDAQSIAAVEELHRQSMGVGAMRALIADDSYAATFQSMGQYRTALLKAFDPPRFMRPSFGFSGFKWDNAEVQYWPDVTRVATHTVKLTPTITHLLDALRSAIVDVSPAKVD